MTNGYSKEAQAGKAKEKDNRSFREKYGTPLTSIGIAGPDATTLPKTSIII